MPTLQFKSPVLYYGRQEYSITVDEIAPDELGIVFRASDPDEDGVFEATLVPWLNIVSMTRPLMPPVEDAEDGDESSPEVIDAI